MSSNFLKVLKERKENILSYHVGLYDLGETVGEGNFAKVKIARHAVLGTKVAIKVIDKPKLSPTALQKLSREVKIMKMLNHPHICRLYEVIETESEMFLIMEYAEGGELFDYLVAHGRMKEKEARRQFRQILTAIDFCHLKNIIHRDLKAENLLLDGSMNTKIADFGFSNQFVTGLALNTWCGSPPYAAPELFQGKEYEGPEVDIWSLGVVLYVLVCGALPFDGNSLSALKQKVISGKFKIPFFMSSECEALIKKMLVVDPKERASIETLKNDKWICDGYGPLKDPLSMEIKITEEHHAEILKRLQKVGVEEKLVKKSLDAGGFDYVGGMYNLIADEIISRSVIEEIQQPVSPFSIKTPSSPPSPIISPLASPTSTSTSPPQSMSATPSSSSMASPTSSPSSSSMASPTSSPKPEDPSSSESESKARKSPSLDLISNIAQTNDTTPSGSKDENSKPSTEKVIERKESKKSRARSNTVNAKTEAENLRKELLRRSVIEPTSSSSPSYPSEPIPKDTKKRRQRALSLTTGDKPDVSKENGADKNNEEIGFTETASYNPNEGRQSPSGGTSKRLSPQSRSTVSTKPSSPRRLSFKDLFKKTFGMKEDGPKEVKPRSLRFHFSVHTTSGRDARELVVDIEKNLYARQIAFQRDGFLFLCRRDDLAFEMEVCKLPRLSLNGFRFKRLAGDQWAYKEICTDMIHGIKL